jgi:hypothetical protein
VLCDGALQMGFAMESAQITPSILDEAARDLDLDVLPGAARNDYESTRNAPLPMYAERTPQNGGGWTIDPNKAPGPLASDPQAIRQKSLTFFANLMDRWR